MTICVMTGGEHTDGVPLTPLERETMQTALDRGYFENPRQISTGTLAEEVDVSTAEAAEHLRRGTKKLLREGLEQHGTVSSDRR